MAISKVVPLGGQRAGVYDSGRPRVRRQMPDMQVITKGWWTLKEERQPVEEIEKEDRDERKSA